MRYRAGWIVINSETILENGFIDIENNTVKEYGSKKNLTFACKDLGEGVILPHFFNCHTHLELSALKGKIPWDMGFESWVKTLLIEREKLSEDEILKGIRVGIDELINSGSLSVGEISTLFKSFDPINKSILSGVYFKEYLGGITEYEGIAENNKVITSYAGHAPHTTSPFLLKLLKKETDKKHLPFSIHLSESVEEKEFIQNGKGKWAEFLTARGIDYKKWKLPSKSPVKYVSELNILDEKTLCVHLCNADRSDLKVIKESGSKVCLCPSSNINLHGYLPDFEAISELGVEFCLGTDSLSSSKSLDILNETRFLSERFSIFSPKTLFEAATVNGAKALGMKTKGTLDKGMRAPFLYIDIQASRNDELLEKIINRDFNTVRHYPCARPLHK